MERLTAAEFEALRPHLGRLTMDSVKIARMVLVDGVKQSEVATQYGMSRQRIHGIMVRFAAASQAVPTGWRRVEVWLPPELADQVETMADKVRAESKQAARQGRTRPTDD